MPVWCRMFQQTLDGKARAWFGMLKACAKDPAEISKIVRKANESLPNFKERWVSESNTIPNVPDLCNSRPVRRGLPEYRIAQGRVATKGPTTQWWQRNDYPQRGPLKNAHRMTDHKPTFQTQDHHDPYVAPYHPNQNFHQSREQQRDNRLVLMLDSLVSTPKEILTTEHQLQLPPLLPLVRAPKKENMNKLNHLVKDVRRKGKGTRGRSSEGEDNKYGEMFGTRSKKEVYDDRRRMD
ncbi:hypothetical protein Tco_0670899 [Tanacetum coccineum]